MRSGEVIGFVLGGMRVEWVFKYRISRGAVTAADTFEEAYDAAVEIAQILLQQMEAQGLDLPVPTSVNKI
ncbi:hypothetical protein PS870_02197 [Pseudomonas fluorescens]|uniref:Uncharacterized protein n=1 Tax=Pseudomonas fluorescens TaxID=294 RepID=A0A5E7JZK5_PSEFL|nr:hypothetical protein PS870_02197 [Pseudomonas fluorescens]